MTTFALIHGGAHGGWCWERLVPELERRGHSALAPDLPFDEASGAKAWADTVIAAIDAAGGSDDVVLVGHSMGGMALPVIAGMRTVRRMVFLGAMVPVPGRVYGEYLAEETDAVTMVVSPEGEGSPSGVTWESARDGFYNDVAEPVARAAWERLRPTAMTVFTEQCPIGTWPDVPSTYILLTEDRAVGQAWSRRAAARIGADLIEMSGGHSPFLSRPAELADVLSRL